MKKFIYDLSFFPHDSLICFTIYFFLEFIQSSVLSYTPKLKQTLANTQTIITTVGYLEKAHLAMATLTK